MPSVATAGRRMLYFNPRPSYEERPPTRYQSLSRQQFQSTPLIRGATVLPVCRQGMGDFNPRPSYEERRMRRLQSASRRIFQSTPLIRGATVPNKRLVQGLLFQSTPLIRGATAILSPLHFSSFHPPFSRTSSFPTSDISFLQQYLSSAFLCDSTSHASKESSALPDHRWSLHRYVLSFPYNSSRDDRTADCLFLHRWPFRAYAGIPRTVLCRGCIRKQNSALFVRDARRSLLLA